MNTIKSIALYIIVSIIVVTGSGMLESDSIFTYLRLNIITLLLTLLAINVATLGLIASKMQDFLMEFPAINFSEVTRQMKLSLKEQIYLIFVSVVTLILAESKIISANFPVSTTSAIFNVFLFSVFLYAIEILWDTGKAVFVVIDEINKINKKIK